MKLWIFLTIFLVSAVIGYVDEWNLVHYSKSKDELMKCLENTNLSTVLNENDENSLLKLNVIGKLSDLMHEVTVPVGYIDVVASNVVHIVRQRSHLLHMQSVSMNNTNDEFKGDLVDVKKEIEASGVTKLTFDEDEVERVTQAIINAFHECSDLEDPTRKISPGIIAPPHFVQEIPEMAELLDMILVTRLQISHDLTEFSFSRLLEFSERSLTLIEAALCRMNNAYELTNELSRMWNRRARLFFDGRKYFEYLPSHYGLNGFEVSTVLMCGIPNRLFDNIIVRDPPADYIADGIFEMTRYRALDWNNPMISRVFSVPSTANKTITRSQYYFKRKIHEFFQKSFAYLEVVKRGLTLKSEIYKWLAYFKELPMLHDPFEDGYGAFLKTVQRKELSQEFASNSPIFSSLVQSLRQSDQINEYDLLMMYWHRLRHINAITNTAATTKNWYNSFKHQLFKAFIAGPSKSRKITAIIGSTTVTPFYTNSSSTLGYDETKRSKGPVIRLPSGKFILKNQHESSDDNGNNNPSTGNERKYSYNSNDMGKNCGKFSVDLSDSEDSVIFLTTLDSLMPSQGSLSFY